MRLEPGCFQTRHFGILLSSAALAIALVLQTSPASAEAVTLICQIEGGSGSFTLRVDYDRKIVELLNVINDNGTAYMSAPATITEAAVNWNAVVENTGGYRFMGSLNRHSGRGKVSFPLEYRKGDFADRDWSGPCRRATQKF